MAAMQAEGRPQRSRKSLTRVLVAAWAIAALAYVFHTRLQVQGSSGGLTMQQLQQPRLGILQLAGLQQAAAAAARGGSGGSGPTPIRSQVGCDQATAHVTARELDLQQQRRCALAAAGGDPPGGYVAACLAVKNQHRDLAEWLDWHARLGIARVYVMDAGSDPPLDDLLAPYVRSGLVVHRLVGNTSEAAADLGATTCRSFAPRFMQLLAYSACLRDYGAQHQWMAFIDADEFIVPASADIPADLPALLRGYEQYGGVALNWRMFGSGGHKKRQNSTLQAFTKCYAKEEEENRHIKTIGNMAFMTRTDGPHHALYAPGYYAVTPNGQRVDGPRSARADYSSWVLHHYVTKSWEDYQDKIARGSGMGNKKTVAFWERVQSRAVKKCGAAADLLERWRQEGAAGR